MTLRLVQFVDTAGQRAVAAKQDDAPYRVVQGATTTYALAKEAIAAQKGLADIIEAKGLGEDVDVAAALAEGRVLAPLDHEDPAHAYVTGTGLTHLGSAAGRDAMHKKLEAAVETLTDSMKMFQKGVQGGKPAEGQVGAQPEWFYKGDGSIIANPEQPLVSPHFALDGGEEPEIVGLYVIGGKGSPYRLGYALGNEFSDHVTEKENYLYLAHSKLRQCSFGPELLVGELPADVRGSARIRRGNETVWEKPFISGEDNMCHSLRNLEGHHFKYSLFRRPGDVHIHYFGTATASFADGVRTEDGDVFEIEAGAFTLPLRNPLKVAADDTVAVKTL
jgi:hypothetical protein